MAKSHTAVWASDAPTPAQLKEFFAQIENGRVTKDRLQSFLCGKHIIDCDASPYVPDGWTIEEHQKGGQLDWEQTKVELYLSDGQKNGKIINGTELRKELAKRPVLNANVLDYLLAHPELIPEEWKGKVVFFWGTTYRYSDGGLDVRCLGWNGSQWYWNYHWLDNDWNETNPAVVRASSA